MQEGRLLGHIVLADGICIDLECVARILKINVPRNKKDIQYFIGKIKI